MPLDNKEERFSNPVLAAADEILRKCEGDREKASAQLVKKLKQAQFREQAANFILDNVVSSAIRAVTAAERRLVWTGGRNSHGAVAHATRGGDIDRESIIALAESNARGLFDFALPGGKRLADADKSEVEAAAEWYIVQGRAYSSKGAWLWKIGKALPDGKTVSQIFDEGTLRTFQAEALDEAA